MKKRKVSRKLEFTAFHEAGHAVMSYRLRRGLKCVTIEPEPTKRSLGHTQNTKKIGFRPDLRQQRKIEDEILICLAGPAAEREKRGLYNHRGAAADYQKAADLALYVCADEICAYTDQHQLCAFVHDVDAEQASAYIRWLQVKCRKIVELNWYIIEALASQLLEHKRIGARKVRTIIKNAIEADYQARLALARRDPKGGAV